jgi:uncharacterized membrane protein
MALMVHNKYYQDVYVAILYPNSNCQPGSRWAKQGWWRASPGQTVTVVGGDLSPESMYYVHASADDGTSWGDAATSDTCPNEGFNICSSERRDAPSYEFFEVYSNQPNKTISLTGGGGGGSVPFD